MKPGSADMPEPRLPQMISAPPNDWPLKAVMLFSAALILLMAALLAAAAAGYPVPVITQAAGFIFLSFLPGLLLLRVLRIHNTGFLECTVYAAGLSLALDMALVFLLNSLLPALGIQRPVSLWTVGVAFILVNSLLLLVAWLRDREFRPATPPERVNVDWPPLLLLGLLLCLTILGARLADAYGNNLLLMACLVFIATIAALAAFGKLIRPSLYPFAIFTIGLCLLYQTTLMTPYLVGSDIYTEYHLYNLTAGAGRWDSSIYSIVNSCLSITLLAPLYAILMNIAGVWVFKAVFPLLFALVPVVLYRVFSLQSDSRTGFLAVFLFLAVPTFSLEMISLVRQQVAELFLVLLILLLVERRLPAATKLVMALVFAAGVIVSHYGIGTIGFIHMAMLLPLVLIIRSGWFRALWGRIAGGQSVLPPAATAFPAWVLLLVVAFYFAAGLCWYYFTASGINFIRLTDFWQRHSGEIVSGAVQIGAGTANTTAAANGAAAAFAGRDALIRTALGLDFASATLQGRVFRVLQIATQLLLIIGILRFIFRPGGYRFRPEFLALCVSSAAVLAACIILPGFAERFNTSRMYHLALVTLAPFTVIGCLAVWEVATWGVKLMRRSLRDAPVAAYGLPLVWSAVVIPYFIICSGLVFEISGQAVTDRVDTPYSIALSRHRLDLNSSFSAPDGAAAGWLAGNIPAGSIVYADHHTPSILQFMSVPGRWKTLTPETGAGAEGYIFLSAWNTSQDELTYATGPGLRKYVSLQEISIFDSAAVHAGKIYANGSAQVFAVTAAK